MSTKRVGIELLCNRLSGSGVEADLNKRYPYKVVEQVIARVYRDSSLTSQPFFKDMAQDYEYDIDGKEITLSPKPVGSHGLIWVEVDGVFQQVFQGGMEAKILRAVEPGANGGCRLINGKRLKFEDCFTGKVCVTMIPAFEDLADTDEWLMPGAESAMYEMVVQLIKLTDIRPEEAYNDGRDDVLRVEPKQQRVN